MPAAMEWEVIASRHRAMRQESIPREWVLSDRKLHDLKGVGTPLEGRLHALDVARKSEILTEKEIEITERYDAKQLLTEIHGGSLSSEEVTVAFAKRAALAQQLTNCLTEIFFDEGIERAKELDRHLKSTGKVVGPLHGLPISLKDSFKVKGHHATVGYVEFLKRPPPDSNSAMVDLLLDAGAVLFCKTNVPQTMMTADSDNNVFGRTLNPHKTALTAGGSTGGEGALISFRGSILGVGTDIAGSVRIPSLCCGIYGFKPTADRLPFAGQAYYPFPKPGRLPGVTPVAGPMAQSADDLALLMEVVLKQRPWKYDSSVLDVPWRAADAAGAWRRLRIGVMPEDPEYPFHPPVRRALEDAVSKLSAAGHEVIRLPPDASRSAGLSGRLGFHYFAMTSPGGEDLAAEIGEPLVASVARGVPTFSESGSPLITPGLDAAGQLGEFLTHSAAYADRWRQTWVDHDLDVVVGPGAVSTATPHDKYGIPVYTVMWNVLDYPAGIIPYGFASKELDPKYRKAMAAFDADYDPEASDGAPCAIQVVAPRFRDEECLEAIRIIDADIRK
ncbi:Acetamidase 4 [Colletotrichum musicola]|uniref:Acetamidase 4 n=1 Tax=Colletotrichum musicola TaxID=2175873 RepID=A0A8H6IU68_9PEZI|nr:Acetamidase 4 [Colletotrichum musicola]